MLEEKMKYRYSMLTSIYSSNLKGRALYLAVPYHSYPRTTQLRSRIFFISLMQIYGSDLTYIAVISRPENN
jgi:hypothetical protein